VNYYVFQVHLNISMALNTLLHYLLVRISSINDVNYCVLTLAACLLLTAIVKCVMKLWRTRSVLRGAHQAWPSWWWLARVIAWALCSVRDRGIVQGRGMYLHQRSKNLPDRRTMSGEYSVGPVRKTIYRTGGPVKIWGQTGNIYPQIQNMKWRPAARHRPPENIAFS